jgi:hypothetical protein
MVARVLIPLFVFLASSFGSLKVALAGACCGGATSTSSLIVADEKTLFGFDIEAKTLAIDVSASGIWRTRSEIESQQILRLHFATLVSDRWQLGFQPGFISRSRSDETHSQLADTSVFTGYEALTDWDYHPWRPKGIIYLSTTFPTGRSIFSSSSKNLLDTSGRGYPTLAFGLVLTKNLASYGLTISSEMNHGIPHSSIFPSWGYNASVGLSYNLNKISSNSSFYLSIAHIYQNAFHVYEFNQLEDVSALQVTSMAFGFSHTLGAEDPMIAQIAYSDQSLIGQPLNTPLSKSLVLTLKKQIQR